MAEIIVSVPRGVLAPGVTLRLVEAGTAPLEPRLAIAVTSPEEGQRISGRAIVAVSISAEAGVGRVWFSVDGELLGERSAPPYVMAWNSALNQPGERIVTAGVEDIAGAVSTSSPVRVVVEGQPISAPPPPPIPPPPSHTTAAFGRGVFAHVVADRGMKERNKDLWEFWARDTAVAGTQCSYGWDVLEPERRRYNWGLVRQHMAPWMKHGKKVWIEVQTCNKRSVGKEGLPGWVRSLIPTVSITNEFGLVTYPVFWDAVYQQRWFEFLTAFAAEFDGDPGIEFISTGGYSPGHEPRGYGSDDGQNPDLLRQLQPYGYDGLEPSGVWYRNAFTYIVSFYKNIFTRTRLAQTMTYEQPFSVVMQELCGGRGLDYIFVNNGFSYKHATAEMRATHRTRSLDFDADVGMAEFGPAGVGELTVSQLYRGAIGEPGDSSRLCYLPLAHELLVPGATEAIETVAWAAEHLRMWVP